MKDKDSNLFEVELQHKENMEDIFSMTLCSKDYGCVQFEKMPEL